jgi:hypothetical protein
MEEFITSSPIDVGGSPHVMSVEEMARNNEAWYDLDHKTTLFLFGYHSYNSVTPATLVLTCVLLLSLVPSSILSTHETQ